MCPFILLNHARVNLRTRDPLVLGHVSNVLVTVTVGNTNQTAFRPAMKFSWKLIPPTDGSSKMQETMTSPMLVETAQVQPCSTSQSNDQATSRPQEVCQLVRKVLRKDGQVRISKCPPTLVKYWLYNLGYFVGNLNIFIAHEQRRGTAKI